MSYRKLILPLVVATLGASFVHDVSAQWGSGGSLGSPRKGFETLQLYCDLSHPNSNVTIESKPSNAQPTARPSFKFSGPMVCAEVPVGLANPTLNDAISFVAGPFTNEKAIGLFQLDQVTSPALFPGLNYSESSLGGATTRSWSFDVTGRDVSFPFAQLLYELKPVDDKAKAFCDPANIGVAGEPPVLDPLNCKALFGLQLPPMASDYPGPDVFSRIVNGIELSAGQVFTFSTKTEGGVERAQKLAWAPCHTQRFIGPLTPEVLAKEHSAVLAGITNVIVDPCCTFTGIGTVTGSPLQVPIPLTQTNPLHLTVQPNDIWSARNVSPLAFWSNADGLVRNLFTNAANNSYKTEYPSAGSGVNYLDQLDPEAATFFCGLVPPDPACPSGTPGAIPNQIGQNVGGNFPIGENVEEPDFEAPPGALVGRVGSSYSVIGTAATIPAAPGQILEFFFWDTNALNNVGSLKLTIATESIQCKVGAEFVPATTGALRVSNSVEVVYEPTLNVQNISTSASFPTTIVGCSNYSPPFTIQPDGHPIMSSEAKVLVNGVEVPFTKFHVANTISRPSCDGGQPLPDLKLDINRKSFIDVVAPGGNCSNGSNTVKVEVGSDANGWYAGTAAVTLSKCN